MHGNTPPVSRSSQPSRIAARGRVWPLAVALLSVMLLVSTLVACHNEASQEPTRQPPQNTAAKRPQQPAKRHVVPPTPASEVAPLPAPIDVGKVAVAARSSATLGPRGVRPHSYVTILDLVRSNRREQAIAALEYSIDALPDHERDVAGFLLGKLLVEQGRPEGLTYLQALPQPFGAIEDRRLALVARAQLLAGETRGALDTIRALERFRGSEDRYPLRLEAARILANEGDVDGARSMLAANRHAGTSVPRHLRAETMRLEVDLLAESNPKQAVRVAKQLLVGHPAETATLRPGLPASPADLSATEAFKRAERLEGDWAYVEAREAFRGLMDHPTLGYKASWRVAEISARYYRDDPAGARAIYQDLRHRGGEYSGKIPFRIVHTYLKEHDYEKALEGVQQFSSAGETGMFYRGWIPYQQHNCTKAQPYLERYGNQFKDSTVKGFVAWCMIRDERWEEAVDAFQQLVKYGNPIVRGKALYWQAYALQKQGKNDRALEKLRALHQSYPLTYYDILGYQMEARWAGKDPTASKLPIFADAGRAAQRDTLDAATWQWPNVSSSTRQRLEDVRRLVLADELELARASYAKIRDQVERSVPAERRWSFIHFMGHQVENHYHGWEKASGSIRGMSDEMPEPDDARWMVAYPRAYRPLVERIAAQYGVTEYLIYAIMQQESRYRWYQISSWDAVGALQMIPKTAVKVAEEVGLHYDRHTFTEPRVGFEYSAFYMAKHFGMWKNLTLTAASYNGGPHKVERWMRDNSGASMDFLVEEFTFDQSRHYCRKVAEHMLRYIYLYEDDAQRRGELIDALFPLAVDYDIPEDTGY